MAERRRRPPATVPAAALALPAVPPAVGGDGNPPRCLLEAPEPESKKGNNFSKGVRWSPDGTTLLTAHDDSTLRLFAVNPEVLASSSSAAEAPPDGVAAGPGLLEPYAKAVEGGPVLDFAFFPSFSWQNPATCCFIASSQDHPIHLREAVGGTLCNSYRPFNQVEEVCHAYSICFSPDGGKILGGFSQYIRVFDVQRPGRQVEDWLLTTKKGKGQKGIIGALAGASESPGLYAAGSYNRSVCVYHQGSRGKPVAWLVDREQDYEMGGVTQLAWANEWLLLSGHRRDPWLRAWDLRMASSDDGSASEGRGLRPKALLHRFPRSARTHQRFLFGVQGCRLSVGTDEGDAVIYSLSTLEEESRIVGAHTRPCVSAMLHPTCNALVTSAGGRCFPNYDVESSAGSDSDSPAVGKKRPRGGDPAAGGVGTLDNSVRVWCLGGEAES